MAERRKLDIQSFTEVKTAESGRKYWTFQNTQQQKFVCFIPALREHCLLGQTMDAEIEPAKKEGDSPRLVNIYEDGKAVHQAEKKPFVRAESKEDIVARHKSMAISYAKDLVVAGKIDIREIAEYSEMFYSYIVGDLKVDEAKLLRLIMPEPKEQPKPDALQSQPSRVAKESSTATPEDWARLKEQMELYEKTPEDIKELRKKLGLPIKNADITKEDIDRLIVAIEHL